MSSFMCEFYHMTSDPTPQVDSAVLFPAEEVEIDTRRWRNMSELCFKLGMGQILVEGGQPDRNIGRAVDMISRAAEEGCRIVVLPECLDLGWTNPSAKSLALPVPGPVTDKLAAAAVKGRIHVVAGLTERDGEKVYNTAVLISPEGGILLKHRKINVLDIAQDLYSIGDRLGVVETPLGVIGINICADNFPGSLVFAHSLARMGAQMILSPSAWAVAANHDNRMDPYGGMWKEAYGTIGRLYDTYVVGVSNVGWIHGGPWDGMKCIGNSIAAGPGGNVVAEGPYGEAAEQLVVFEVRPVLREKTGTSIYGMLRERGYDGP